MRKIVSGLVFFLSSSALAGDCVKTLSGKNVCVGDTVKVRGRGQDKLAVIQAITKNKRNEPVFHPVDSEKYEDFTSVDHKWYIAPLLPGQKWLRPGSEVFLEKNKGTNTGISASDLSFSSGISSHKAILKGDNSEVLVHDSFDDGTSYISQMDHTTYKFKNPLIEDKKLIRLVDSNGSSFKPGDVVRARSSITQKHFSGTSSVPKFAREKQFLVIDALDDGRVRVSYGRLSSKDLLIIDPQHLEHEQSEKLKSIQKDSKKIQVVLDQLSKKCEGVFVSLGLVSSLCRKKMTSGETKDSFVSRTKNFVSNLAQKLFPSFLMGKAQGNATDKKNSVSFRSFSHKAQ